MDNYDEEKIFLNSQMTAQNDKLFVYLNNKKDSKACTSKSVSEFLKYAYNLSIVDNYLQYTDNSGEVHVLYTTKGITKGGEWLSSKLPSPPFDVFQGDNLRKSQEAQNIFIASNIKSIVNDDLYTEEFNEVMDDYDFNSMRNLKGLSFTGLVLEWSKENSILLNIIISASKYVLVEHKKDEQSFIGSLLPKEEATGISDIKARIDTITYEYTKPGGDLSNKEIKKLSKIELLTTIAKCNREKDKVIDESEFGILFKITKLTSEYLSLSNRKKLRKSAGKSVIEQCKSLKLDNDAIDKLIGKCTRRLIKAAVHSLHKVEILKYLEDKMNYELPPKI